MSAAVPHDEWGTLTPDEIRNQRFLPAAHGYDRSDVRSFLFQLAELVAHLEREVAALVHAPKPAPTSVEIASEAQRIVQTAFDDALELRQAARALADEEIAIAGRQAGRLVDDAQRRRRAIAHIVRQLTDHRDNAARDLQRLRAEVETAVADLGPPPPAPTPSLF
jgi:DivIVA domain-containing protein